MTDELNVSQRARDAAIAFGCLSPGFDTRNGSTWSAPYLIRRGEWDNHPAVKFFAQFEAYILADQACQIEALDWFGSQRSLALDYYSPVYGDDDDESREWRVTKESGSINDREWTIVGRGQSPVEAIIAARATLEETHSDR